MADAALSLSAVLRDYVAARTSALTAARRLLGITDMDARALLYIVDNPGVRPSALSDYLGITSGGVSTLVDRLISRGVVRRDVDPTDRRVNRITSTIDISGEPWAALRRFDDDIDLALTANDPITTGELALVLAEATAAASARS
jgi:DNA-binding MarR family transcriptional regulator